MRVFRSMKIFFGTDHRGFQLKETLKKFLLERNFDVEDMGAFSYDKDDDYPDFTALAAAKVAENSFEHRGIFLCGSGHGVDIVANKYKGVRAALCWNSEVAKQSREHENANVLVLPADWVDEKTTKEIVAVWLATEFSNEERHVRRLEKIKGIEGESCR